MTTTSDKRVLLEALVARVAADLEALERRQRDAAEGATHEESRAEHAKDTRATEQSYLARGLAERVADLRRTLEVLSRLAPRAFAPDEAIATGAWIRAEVEVDEETDEDTRGDDPSREARWLLVPGVAGLELADPSGPSGATCQTVTPASPLGRALVGLCRGDEGVVRTPRGARRFEVLEVR